MEKEKIKTDMATLKAADWDKITKEVNERIAMLRATCEMKPSPAADKIANDLILPNIMLLGEFITNIEIE